MKIFVEQISISQGILTYSNFCKYTENDDEDGSDYEYDFESIYGNVDNIQSTIQKLYGTKGLIQIFEYYAQGNNGDLLFEAIEFEESSPLKEMIDKLDGDISVQSDVIIKKDMQPQSSDAIYLLNGLLSGLPINEDLNVMKMLSGSMVTLNTTLSEKCLNIARTYGIEGDCAFYEFQFDNISKIVLVGKHTFISLIKNVDDLILDFPRNEIQEKSVSLFFKYVNITKVSKLKKSIILDLEFNDIARRESQEPLRNYLVLFNVETSKLESKELKLTL